MEDAAYPTVAPGLSLDRYIALHNQRLPRMAQQLARTQRWNVRTTTASTTLTEADDLLLCDSTGGNITVTVPAAAGNRGKVFMVKKLVAANTVTIDPADNIDGAASLAFTTQWQSYTFVSDGADWYVV